MRLTLGPDQDLVALARGAPVGESLTIVIEPGRDALSLALARAALAPLSIERAPARVNAVLAAPDADPDDREAAMAWLDRGRSTTGQLIEISARPHPEHDPPASARTPPATR